MELKKTVKYDIKEKGLRILNGKVVNGDGEIVDLIGMLEKAYKNSEFDFSSTAKTEETYDLGAND